MKSAKWVLSIFALCFAMTACSNNSDSEHTTTDSLSNTNAIMQDGTAADMNGNSTGGAAGIDNAGRTNMNNTAARPGSGESEGTGGNGSRNIKRRDTAGSGSAASGR